MCSTNGCFRSIHNCRWMLSCLKLHCRSCSYWDALGEQQNFLEGVRRLFSLPRAKDYNQELAFENFSQFSWWNMSQQIGVSVPDSETLSSDKSKRFTVGLISQYFFLASSLSFVALDEFVFYGNSICQLTAKKHDNPVLFKLFSIKDGIVNGYVSTKFSSASRFSQLFQV